MEETRPQAIDAHGQQHDPGQISTCPMLTAPEQHGANRGGDAEERRQVSEDSSDCISDHSDLRSNDHNARRSQRNPIDKPARSIQPYPKEDDTPEIPHRSSDPAQRLTPRNRALSNRRCE
jgi:hypothetical protein